MMEKETTHSFISTSSGSNQCVDPEVTKAKFDEELAAFKAADSIHRKRGVILLDVKFPNIYVAFCAHKLSPPAIAFAVRFNFDNYDVEPLSIQFINPFTFEPILVGQMKVGFPRRLSPNPEDRNFQNLLVWHNDGVPFFCMPGVREYHSHVAHTGDSWWLHRKRGGEGSMGFLIENLYAYGIEGIAAYRLQWNFDLNIPNLNLQFNEQAIPL
jgi:hypothetical protein